MTILTLRVIFHIYGQGLLKILKTVASVLKFCVTFYFQGNIRLAKSRGPLYQWHKFHGYKISFCFKN